MTSNPYFRIVIMAVSLFLLVGSAFGEHPTKQVAPKLKILILGGTGFIGPWEIEAALAHGHEVTLFNRGKSRPDLFPELERLKGDRDPDKGDGLKALEGRKFDVVIDNSGYYPRHVKASAELLAPNVKHYIYISSISAYASTADVGQDETAALVTMEDPTVEEMGENWENYGPLKALCEAAAEEAMPGRVTIVRPGYIVGPGDHTFRFSYWPLRIRQGGEVAVPGGPDDPIQVIDARDLTEWVIHLAEKNITGVFNGCGPDRVLTMREVVETAKSVTGSDATFTWLGTEFEDAYFPIWTPNEGEYMGFHTFSNASSIKAGLKFRPLADTTKALLDQFDTLPEEKRAEVMSRIPKENEAALIEAAAVNQE